MILHVKLTPRSSADKVEGWGVDVSGRAVLKVRVRAQPIEGEANSALEKLLARGLGLPVSDVRVRRGGQSRLKAVEVDGATPTDIEAAFGAPPI